MQITVKNENDHHRIFYSLYIIKYISKHIVKEQSPKDEKPQCTAYFRAKTSHTNHYKTMKDDDDFHQTG